MTPSPSNRSTRSAPGKATCRARPSWPSAPTMSVFLGAIAVDGSRRRVVLVLLADDRLAQRDRPGDRDRRVVERERGIGDAGTPVLVDEVGVGRRVLEHLIAVADAARDEDGDRGVHLEGEGGAEGLALAHVDPGAEDPAGRQRDELVPRLGVDAARHAAVGVEGDVVLHRAEVGQPDREHLLALPVLLEEPAGVVATVEPDDDQAGDRRGLEARQVFGGAGVTGPSGRTSPRSRPCGGATSPRGAGTTRWCWPGRTRSPGTAAASRAPGAACPTRWRSACRGRRGR